MSEITPTCSVCCGRTNTTFVIILIPIPAMSLLVFPFPPSLFLFVQSAGKHFCVRYGIFEQVWHIELEL